MSQELNMKIEREINMRKDKESQLLNIVDQKTKFLRYYSHLFQEIKSKNKGRCENRCFSKFRVLLKKTFRP